MRVLDLFSGVGGFSLGLERAGMTTVAFCEIDDFCRQVLAKHWPRVPIYGDVRALKPYDLFIDGCWPIDVICGGFPCQPFSSASRGRKKGATDDRFLWPEMRRLIDDLRPAWVIAENVVQFNGVAFDAMVSDLETSGYEVETLEIPACAVGQDHWRSRLWILGNANGNCKPKQPINAEVAVLSRDRSGTGSVGKPHGVPSRMDRLAALGNAVHPKIPEIIGRAIMGTGRVSV